MTDLKVRYDFKLPALKERVFTKCGLLKKLQVKINITAKNSSL